MAKSNATENDFVAYVFNAAAISWDALTDLYVALHTADPGEAGTQATNECAYGDYARVAVARTAGGWTVAGNVATNTAVIAFPICASGTETATHVSVGVAASGATQILYKGALAASLDIEAGVPPTFQAGALVATEN